MTKVWPTFLLGLALLLVSCAPPPGPQPTPTAVGFTSYGRFFFQDPDKFPTDLTAGPDGAVWFTERAARIGRITLTCFNRVTGCAFPDFALPNVHSGPRALTVGPDGAFWFTDYGTNSIGRMTLTGAVTEFALHRPLTLPWDITTGPDGALWFTEPSLRSNVPDSAIGRITSAGVITRFPVPPYTAPVP
jgi:virginiamycin B lyase